MNKIIENIKSGNYEVVDNKGVSVTGHFTQCLEKEFADLEAKLAEKDKELNQKTIELLQELLQKTQPLNLIVKSDHYVNQKQVKVVFEDVIMQKISELKGNVKDE